MITRSRFIACSVAAVLAVMVVAAASRVFPASAEGQVSSMAARGSVPRFMEVNGRYSIRWQPGANEVYRVLEIRDGWVRARRDPGNAAEEGAKPLELWLNPAQAITITEAQ